MNAEIMSTYKCATCNRTGCKLWREYSPAGRLSPLLCCDCAGRHEKVDVSDIDAHGRRLDKDKMFRSSSRTDQIGWYVPAVPHDEPGMYWGYSEVPADGVAWWRSLPTRPLELEVTP
jgi:hypothetical protein